MQRPFAKKSLDGLGGDRYPLAICLPTAPATITRITVTARRVGMPCACAGNQPFRLAPPFYASSARPSPDGPFLCRCPAPHAPPASPSHHRKIHAAYCPAQQGAPQ